MAQQQTLEEAFHATGETELDEELWNRLMRELAARFRGLEGIKIAWEEVSRQGIDLALARINETLAPAAERIRNLTELGFLLCSSATPATLGNGQVLTLEVTEGAARELFTPSPFLMLTRALSADDYAVARFRTYERDTGALEVEVITFAGDPGPHEDWSIGAIAGSTLAQLLLLDQGRAAQADTVGKAADVVNRHANIVTRHANMVELNTSTLTAEGIARAARDLAVTKAAEAKASATSINASAMSVDAWFNL